MNNYLDFLVDLWQLTKKDGGFKTFESIVRQHGVDKSVSVVLKEQMRVSKHDGVYTWKGRKPTKADAEELCELLKKRKKARKDQSEIKANVNDIQKRLKKKKSVVEITDGGEIKITSDSVKIKSGKTKSTNTLTQLAGLSEAISEMGKAINTPTHIGPASDVKTPNMYAATELDSDVSKVLEETINEQVYRDRILSLETELSNMKLFIATERQILHDDNERLSGSVTVLEHHVESLTEINSKLREQLDAAKMANDNVSIEIERTTANCNFLSTKLEETAKS